MKYIYFFLALSTLLSMLGGAFLISKINRAYQTIEKAKTSDLTKAVDNGVKLIVDKINVIYTVAQTIERLAITRSPLEEIEKELRNLMTKNSALISCGIAYAPYMYDSTKELVSRRVVHVDNNFTSYAIDAKENYTDTEWYRRALSGTPYMSSPFLDDISKQMIVRYSYPFYLNNATDNTQQFGGVAIVSIPVITLDNFVLEMSLDKSTYAMLLDINGALLAHPTEIVTNEEKNIQNLARTTGNKNLLELYNHIKDVHNGGLEITLGAQNNLFKTMFRKIPNTPWYLILMYLQNTNPIPSHQIFRMLILLLLIALVCIISLGSILFYLWCPPIRATWLSTSLSAVLFAAAIGTIWALDLISDIPDIQREYLVNTYYSLQRFLYLEKKNNPAIYKKDPILIPTGIYITSFETEHNGVITVMGQVWQKYDRTKYPDLEPNVLFLNATEQTLEKNSVSHKGTLETINWWFKASFQADFNYLKYPFDEQELVLTLAHKEYESNIILTPDFEAFLSNDSPKSEIDPAVHSNQWTLQQSYAFYTLTDYQTDFGIEEYPGQKGFPNLNYGIRIRRQFVYPLTASALPVVIILFVVFAIVLLTGLTAHHDTLATEIIKLTSSIFFATAVAHQTFQRSLQSPVVTYFEYFYFLIYGVILMTAINGLLYAYGRGGTLINTNNNMIMRMLYWPVTLALCLGLTLWFFY